MLKLLVLFPKRLYHTKMSQGRRHVIEELTCRNDVDVRISGPGWRDYNLCLSLDEQLDALTIDGELPDAILWYKATGSNHSHAIIEPSKRRGIPSIVTYNEAWWPDRLAWKEVKACRDDIIIHHHKADAAQFESDDPDYRPLVHHMAHCARQDIFGHAALPWHKRDIPILVTGALSADIYPLRTLIAELITSGKLPGMVHRHPGYRLDSPGDCDRQVREYAELLGRARIVIGCASKYNYGLARFVESAMAGAMIYGQIPPDYTHTLGRFFWCTDIFDAAHHQACLSDIIDADFSIESLELQANARRSHSTTVYCDRLLKIVRRLIRQRAAEAANTEREDSTASPSSPL